MGGKVKNFWDMPTLVVLSDYDWNGKCCAAFSRFLVVMERTDNKLLGASKPSVSFIFRKHEKGNKEDLRTRDFWGGNQKKRKSLCENERINWVFTKDSHKRLMWNKSIYPWRQISLIFLSAFNKISSSEKLPKFLACVNEAFVIPGTLASKFHTQNHHMVFPESPSSDWMDASKIQLRGWKFMAE